MISSRRAEQLVAWALFLTAIVTGYYWFEFYTGRAVRASDDRCYLVFQQSFPVADAWMAGCSALAGFGLLTRRSFGRPCGLMAGSALIFLALMDITFNVQNGLYPLAATSNAMRAEIVINLWTFGLGSVAIAVLWSRQNQN